jgi:hypothetical protein
MDVMSAPQIETYPSIENCGDSRYLTDFDRGKGREKSFTPLDVHNPLKSHDPDERIQEKPRKSKPRIEGKPQ